MTTTHPPTGGPAPRYSVTDEEMRALADPQIYDDPKAECDLIMKGGITSGVVYPLTACRLAGKYRFRRLGGASAGAIAATFAAAAELGRHQPVDPPPSLTPAPGFVGLQALPNEMGTNLFQLFQPTASLRTAYELLTSWIEPDWKPPRKIVNSVRLIVGREPLIFAVVSLLALIPVIAVAATLLDRPSGGDWLRLAGAVVVFLPAVLTLGLLASAAWVVRGTLRRLPEHGFGLCDGHSRAAGYDHPPLTDWMGQRLNTLAGRPADGPPLTFADLWGDAATGVYRDLKRREAARDGERPPGEKRPARLTPLDWRAFDPQIDVLAMTTALTFGRPYQFPFTSKIFSFCKTCWESYFPPSVINHLVRHSTEVLDDAGEPAKLCPDHHERVRSLPEAPDLPVVLAARLSVSFPALISAVPLYCGDRNRMVGHQGLIKVWFSDGGIASNFPMHFFDNVWPARPTFGINLADPHPDSPDLVWRPENGAGGIVPRSIAITSIPAFLASMMGAMQNWADTTQLTLPGFRDRVVEVRTTAVEGGINLKMKPDVITGLARRGAEAAKALDDFDFDLHRWIRYRVSMAALAETLDDMDERYGDPSQGNGFGSWLTAYRPGRYRLTGRAADQVATEQLIAVAQDWRESGYPALNDQIPRPRPRTRHTPTL